MRIITCLFKAFLVCAMVGMVCCRSAPATEMKTELKNIHNGLRPLQHFSLHYVEEHPLEYTLVVDISGPDRVTIQRRTLKPDCPEHWKEECWEQRTRQAHPSVEAVQSILKPLVESDLLDMASEPETPPGAARFSLSVQVRGLDAVSVTGRLSLSEEHPGLGMVVDSIHKMAGE